MSISYRADIDGLRALAVMMVTVFHFNLFDAGEAGFMGVDVFFVISGYLITSIIIKDLDRGTFTFKDFYYRRIKRLAPALFFTLLATYLVGLIFLFPDQIVDLSKEIAVAQAYVSNIYFWQNVDYFGLQSSDIHLLHTWSLGLEEQFYIIYPIALFFTYRYLRKFTLHAIILGALVSFGLNLLFVEGKPQATFYLLPTRAWELLIGALVSFAVTAPGPRQSLARLLSYTGIVLIVACLVLYDHATHFPGYFALLPSLGAAAIIYAGHFHGSFVRRLFELSPVVYLGRISYPIYLVHWPINVYAAQYFEAGYDVAMRTLMFVVCLLTAAFVYHAVETPVRRLRGLQSPGNLFKFYGAGLATTGLLVGLVIATDGLPGRFEQTTVELADYVNDRPPPFVRDCIHRRDAPLAEADMCSLGADTAADPTWFVYGDSHAWAAYGAIDAWLTSKGEKGLFTFNHGCLPVPEVKFVKDRRKCGAFNRRVTEFIETTDIENIFVISFWRQIREGKISIDGTTVAGPDEAERIFTNGLANLVERVAEADKRLVIWEPLPPSNTSVPVALAKQDAFGWPAELEYPISRYREEFAPFFNALEQIPNGRTRSFSPSRLLCAAERCRPVLDGKPVFTDNNHLTYSLRRTWAAELRRQLARPN